MQWNDLSVLPQDNAIVLVFVRNDNGGENSETVATAKFNLGKGWLIGFSNFESLHREYSVVKWMEIPLPA